MSSNPISQQDTEVKGSQATPPDEILTTVEPNNDDSFNNSILDGLPILNTSSVWINDTTDGIDTTNWFKINAGLDKSYTLEFTNYGSVFNVPELFDNQWNEHLSQGNGQNPDKAVFHYGNLTGTHYLRFDLFDGQKINLTLVEYNGQHPEIDAKPSEYIQPIELGNHYIEITKQYLEVEFPRRDNWFVEVKISTSNPEFRAYKPDGTKIPTIIQRTRNDNLKVIGMINQTGKILFDVSNGYRKMSEFKIGTGEILTEPIKIGYLLSDTFPLNTELVYEFNERSCLDNDCLELNQNTYLASIEFYQDIPTFSHMSVLDKYWEKLLVSEGGTRKATIIPLQTIWSDNRITPTSGFMEDKSFYEISIPEGGDTVTLSTNLRETEFTRVDQNSVQEMRRYVGFNSIIDVNLLNNNDTGFEDLFSLYYSLPQGIYSFDLYVDSDWLGFGLDETNEMEIVVNENFGSSHDLFDNFDTRILHDTIIRLDYVQIVTIRKMMLLDSLMIPTILEIEGVRNISVFDILENQERTYLPNTDNYPEKDLANLEDAWREFHLDGKNEIKVYYDKKTGLLEDMRVLIDAQEVMLISMTETRGTDLDGTDNPKYTNESLNPNTPALPGISWSQLIMTFIVILPVIQRKKSR